MKFIKSKELETKIEELSYINTINMNVSEMLLGLINNPEISKDELSDLNSLYDFFEMDNEDPDNVFIFNKMIFPSIKKIDENNYNNNDYLKCIKLNNQINKRLSLKEDYYRPYEIFALDDITLQNDHYELSSLGYFETKFSFPTLNENDVTWMNITPNEINTMSKSIKEARGDVIVFGLGLGYYPFMISSKDDVKSITIIERDSEIIEIFRENLLPQFPNKSKISIICDDALNYLNKDLKFDYAFVDLWHNAEDGYKLYSTFRKNERNCKNTTFSYWLENSFIALCHRALLTLIYEQYFEEDVNYSKSSTPFDEVINDLYLKTKNLTIHTIEELDNLVSIASIKNLIIG